MMKEDCIYGGNAYAELGKVTPMTKTLGHRFTLEEAKRLQKALNKAITACELGLLPLSEKQQHMITVTSFKHDGAVTVLAKKRTKPLQRGTTGQRIPLKKR